MIGQKPYHTINNLLSIVGYAMACTSADGLRGGQFGCGYAPYEM